MCALRSAHEASTSGFGLWGLPPGLVLLRNVSSCEPNAELGRNHAWLPVTHMTVGMSEGLFFYYARGCSDLAWNAGRTLVARNRAHLSVLLSHLLLIGGPLRKSGDDSAKSLGWQHGVAQAAAYVRRWAPRFVNHSLSRVHLTRHATHARYYSAAAALLDARRVNLDLEWLLGEASRGLFAPRGCSLMAPLGSPARCSGACERRAKALSFALWADPALDDINRRLLLLLRNSSGEAYDTVVLLQGGFRSLRAHTELWDVRHLHRRNVDGSLRTSPAAAVDGTLMVREPRCDDQRCDLPPPHFGWPNGSRCILSAAALLRCWACNGSELERFGCVRPPRMPRVPRTPNTHLDLRSQHTSARHKPALDDARPRALLARGTDTS